MKICHKCNVEKEETEFKRNFYGKPGDVCKECISIIKGNQNIKKKLKKIFKR